MIRDGGDEPCFLGYTPEGAQRPYPATLCVSINDEIVHGIPNESVKVLKEGDIVGLDLGLRHEGIIVDAAITVPVGKVSEEKMRLMRVTEDALAAGIAAAVPGNHVGDISHAIGEAIERGGFKVVKELGGHGVGDLVHEEPFISNYGRPGTGELLEEGMVLALEPISSAGKAAVVLAPDGYTFRTKDGSSSAHFEHTILLEATEARIMTV
jgi:methionyl aminopeptidase